MLSSNTFVDRALQLISSRPFGPKLVENLKALSERLDLECYIDDYKVDTQERLICLSRKLFLIDITTKCEKRICDSPTVDVHVVRQDGTSEVLEGANLILQDCLKEDSLDSFAEKVKYFARLDNLSNELHCNAFSILSDVYETLSRKYAENLSACMDNDFNAICHSIGKPVKDVDHTCGLQVEYWVQLPDSTKFLECKRWSAQVDLYRAPQNSEFFSELRPYIGLILSNSIYMSETKIQKVEKSGCMKLIYQNNDNKDHIPANIGEEGQTSHRIFRIKAKNYNYSIKKSIPANSNYKEINYIVLKNIDDLENALSLLRPFAIMDCLNNSLGTKLDNNTELNQSDGKTNMNYRFITAAFDQECQKLSISVPTATLRISFDIAVSDSAKVQIQMHTNGNPRNASIFWSADPCEKLGNALQLTGDIPLALEFIFEQYFKGQMSM